METFEVLRKAISGKTVEIAKTLGLHWVTVNKWQEPHTDYTDSGAYNPLDRIEAICDKALQLRGTRENALAPIYYLNHRFGLVCFDMPAITKGGAVSAELLASIKEFSDLAQATSKALLDQRITRMEAAKIITEGEQAIRAIGALIGAVKELQ